MELFRISGAFGSWELEIGSYRLRDMGRRLAVVLILVLVLAGGFLALRGALHPDAMRRAAEARLSTLLGQAVTIGSMRVSLLPVPAVVGSGVTVGTERDRPDITLDRIRIVPRLGSLFGGPYTIREIVLDGLSVSIVREPPGRWRFPSIVPAAGGDSTAGVVVERVRLSGGRVRVLVSTPGQGVRETSSISGIEGEAVADGAGIRVSPLRGTVGGSPISGEAIVTPAEARMDFKMDRIDGGDLGVVLGLAAAEPPDAVTLTKPAAASMSIRIDRLKSRLSGTGSVRAPEVGLYGLRLQSLEAPVTTDGTRLTFNPATFALYGGTHKGGLVVDLARTPPRWTLDSAVTGVDAGDFLAALSGRDQRVDGSAGATAALRGTVGEAIPQTLDGRMRVNIANGVIREFPLLAAINRALRLAEGDLRDTRFERLTATLVFAGASFATTDDLAFDAREVRVEAAGRLGFDRSLNLAGQAVLSADRSASAIRSVRELSGLRNANGEIELPLRITGSLDAPSIGIDLQAAIARSLKQELRRRLRDFIRQ